MLAYAVLTGANGAPVDQRIMRRFATDLAALPFEPEERIVWSNRSGSCVFLGWQAFTDLAGMRSHWAVDERGLTAFTGHCWPRSTGWDHHSGISWGTQLRRRIEGQSLTAARDDLYGQFTLISLDADGEGFVTPDFGGFDPVFLAQDDALTVISNRSGLCARAIVPVGQEPQRSLTGAGWIICHTEMFFDGETGYWDVERIPLGAHVALDPARGAAIVESERCPLGPMGETATYPELLDAVEQDLRQSVRAIAALPLRTRQFGLSGGIDSRLLTALIIDEGLQDRFQFVTYGPPEGSDPLVAREITRRYSLDWTLIDHSTRSPVEARDEMLAHTGLAEGLMNGWNSVGSLDYSQSAIVTGMAGEYLRWGRTSRPGMLVTSEAELIALLRRNINFDPLGLLRPDVLEYYYQTVEHWARHMLARGETLQQIPSYFNQSGQARHRFAVVHAWGERPTFTPFVTPTLVRANQKLPVDQRPDHRFQIDLMRRFVPDLSMMPFAIQGWSEAAIAHLPDADAYRAIPTVKTTSPDGRNWRVLRYQDYRPFLDEILLERSNPIHELIDSDKLERVLPTGDVHGGRVRRIWAVLTAAIWMGHHELPVRIARV